jgi:D-sedoheptulose 7-phosphate isomerase
MKNTIEKRFAEARALLELISNNEEILNTVEAISITIISAYGKGGKVFIAGNGGSAADAQHIAAELVSRFYKERKALAAESLTVSTSGNSKNILSAINTAKNIGMKIIGFTGGDGGKMAEPGMCDHLIKIPSKDTPRIQENHILIAHIICELVENSLFDSV